MVVTQLSEVHGLKKALDRGGEPVPLYRKSLMVEPKHFQVEYAINNFMADESGRLKVVDTSLAVHQWQTLMRLYQSLGLEVEVLPGQPGMPDMVFAANQSFPFWSFEHQKPAVVMSQMAYSQRRSEVVFFEKWYKDRGYVIHHLPRADWRFEGGGDAVSVPGQPVIWCGIGPRTQYEAADHLHRISGYNVVALHLVHPDYYHLDTCFSVLRSDTVAFLPEAFSEEGRAMIQAFFPHVIEIDIFENNQFFAGNCHCPNGRDVICQSGSEVFQNELRKRDFTVHEVETGEFIKSGGSVYCLKTMVPTTFCGCD